MFSSTLFYASSSFIYVTLCPSTIMLFVLCRVSRTSTTPIRATDFYATLMFGVFMTLAGIFGITAESVGTPNSRWWMSASYAAQALGILIAQLAVIQLLTPDYVFGLLSITAPLNGAPSWRIYALILIAVAATVSSLISVFIIPRAPSLASCVPTFVSICLPLPLLLSLSHIVSSTRVEVEVPPLPTTIYSKRSSKCTELGLTASADTSPLPVALRFLRVWEFTFILQCAGALASLCEIIEAGLGRPIPSLRLLSAITNVAWGGGIMTIHFVILNEPAYQASLDPVGNSEIQHDLERMVDQPSEDFMTLRDPFASPTQIGLPLPPSPTSTRRKPRRRASEPFQLTRFGSFANLHGSSNNDETPSEVDSDTQFLEALVRHALFSTGLSEKGSVATHSDAMTTATPTGRPTKICDMMLDDRPGSPLCLSGTSTPTIRQKRSRELVEPKTPEPAPAFIWHPFRPPTPPRSSRMAGSASSSKLTFPEPPSSFPFSSPLSAESGYSLPIAWSRPPSAYMAPPSPEGSDSGSSFVSPPPTPTPGPSGSKANRKVRSLVPARPAPTLAPAPTRRRGSGPA